MREKFKNLFPDISRFENFIYATNVPAKDISGDYLQVLALVKQSIFLLADVSGKLELVCTWLKRPQFLGLSKSHILLRK